MVSNMLFWHQSGYFDAAAQTKPLLHTKPLSRRLRHCESHDGRPRLVENNAEASRATRTARPRDGPHHADDGFAAERHLRLGVRLLREGIELTSTPAGGSDRLCRAWR